MLFLAYAFICFILFGVILFLTMAIGGSMGAGPYEVGYVVVAIDILCIVIIVCTGILVNTIDKINKR